MRQNRSVSVLMASVVALGVGGALVGAQQADDKTLKEDLQAIQGKWISKNQTPQGKTVDLTKVISGEKETVASLEGGQVVYEHRNDVRVSRSGRVKLFTYSNIEVTAGPMKGSKVQGERAYVYNVVRLPNGKQAFFEVHGLLSDGAERGEPPSVIVWERAAD